MRSQCICGSGLEVRGFSDNFNVHRCVDCRSCHFIARVGSGNVEFDYCAASDKYSDSSYLHGSSLRWAHRTLLARGWRGRKVLEVGCFNGFFLSRLSVAGASVYGVDVNAEALSVGRRAFRLSNLFSSLDDIYEFAPFDDIVCIDVVEHVDCPEQLVEFFATILGAGGRVHVAGPTVERRIHDKTDYPPHHRWWFSRMGLRQMFGRLGFELERMDIEYDALLMVRNLIGLAANRTGVQREFYGDVSAAAPSLDRGLVGWVYRCVSRIGWCAFKCLGISYCSTVMTFRRGRGI
jgi:SAM-dependent methyltransferase